VRWVFDGTSAFLGRIDGETRCAFWAGEPTDHGFDPALLIPADLGRTPAAAIAGRIGWDEVQVDDCYTGPNGAVGGTTIGPRWPEMRLAGAVYLERGYAASLPAALRPPCPPAGVDGQRHEFAAALYWPGTDDPRAGNRYAGHVAEIRAEQGTLARVAVWPPGRSADPAADPALMWIDLASPEQCDAGPDSLTGIGTGPGAKRGPLFLISGQVSGAAGPGRPG
jgi:hypothetical protein